MSDSESPFEQSDKPRKRANTGPEEGESQSTPEQSQKQGLLTPQINSTISPQPQVPDASQINEASLKLATLLQKNPGMLALNLAALSQSLAAAHKEGIPSALLNGLMAAAKASAEQGGGASSIAETARVLAAHLQQQPAGSTSAVTTSATTTPVSAQQSLATIQAIAASRANSTLPSAPSPGSTPAVASASAVASPIAQLVAAAQAQAQAQAQSRATTTQGHAVLTGPAPLPGALETSILHAQANALAQTQVQAKGPTPQEITPSKQATAHPVLSDGAIETTVEPRSSEELKRQDGTSPAQNV